MQMMLASAKIAAKQARPALPARRLLTDPAYNMQLGMTECRGHLDRLDGSWCWQRRPTMPAPTMCADGWPPTAIRAPADPIDWIEQIPFGETRNYVQRVLENTEVYRARLAGKDVPLRILADLYAPESRRPVPMLAGGETK